MTDHDPFGPADDDKTVQYAKPDAAPPASAPTDEDDDKTVQYAKPNAAPTPPAAEDTDEDKTVQYRTSQPPQTNQPPPVWHSTGQPAAVPPPGPTGPPPAPSWQQPAVTPGWFPDVPGYHPPPASNRRWWFIGGGIAAALVVIAVVVTIVVASSTSDGPNIAAPTTTPSPTTEAPSTTTESPSTTTSTPPASTGPDDLAGLLESASDVSDRLESPGMTASPVSTELISGLTVTPDNCAGAWTPGLSDTYAGSGYTGAALQLVRDPGQNNHQVNEAIVSFADDAAAKAFYDQQVAAWKACNYQKISAAAQGVPSVSGTTGVAADTDGTTDMLILVDNWPGGGAIQCQRAITNRTNVVVDVLACSPSVGSGGWTIARDIGQKITGQR
jgi:serine/threonine-protein kinase